MFVPLLSCVPLDSMFGFAIHKETCFWLNQLLLDLFSLTVIDICLAHHCLGRTWLKSQQLEQFFHYIIDVIVNSIPCIIRLNQIICKGWWQAASLHGRSVSKTTKVLVLGLPKNKKSLNFKGKKKLMTKTWPSTSYNCELS